jgi:uncharacterized protein
MRSVIRLLKIVALLLVGAYGGAMLMLASFEDDLLYDPGGALVSPNASTLPRAEQRFIQTADGQKLNAWYIAPAENKPVFLFFHGQGGRLNQLANRFRMLTGNGEGLLAVAYRGYNGSTGEPSEDGLHMDADAAYKMLTDMGTRPERIIVVGESLGTGVAVALAAKSLVGGLVLDAPYTSTADLAFRRFPYFPVHFIMEDQFRSDLLIGQIKVPVLMLHGSADKIVPIEFGRRLFNMANEPKRFVEIDGGEHRVLLRSPAQQALRDYVAARQAEMAAVMPAGGTNP